MRVFNPVLLDSFSSPAKRGERTPQVLQFTYVGERTPAFLVKRKTSSCLVAIRYVTISPSKYDYLQLLKA